MALNFESVCKAKQILQDIEGSEICFDVIDDENEYQTGIVLGHGRKGDGGWEHIFLNVRNVTVEQLAMFEQKKHDIPNSSFKSYIPEKGIIRLGWF